jgi:hypothetical protein
MKVGLSGCIAVLMIIIGCGQKGVKISDQPQAEKQKVWDGTPPAQEAIPDFFADAPESNAFPESLAGQWEAEIPNIKWVINFEPDGSIKKVVHSLAGEVNIEQGGVDGNGPDDSYYVFTMGPCETRYMPDTNTLKVKIIVDYFIMKFPAGEIEGRMEDYFEGPVSEDGSTWNTQWRSFGWVKDAAPPPIDLIKANPVPLIFVKIDPNNPPEQTPLQ